MNPVVLILAVVSIMEAAFICFLLYAMNRIMEADADRQEPVEPIEWEDWNNGQN